MLMTGLLSLNIHDSLTFEGTELCLHPDLFPAAEVHSQQTRSTSHKPSSAAGDDNLKSGGATASTGSGATATGSVVGLAVGDMIEIRVWDPIPRDASSGLKSPSTLRGGNTKLRTSSSSHVSPSTLASATGTPLSVPLTTGPPPPSGTPTLPATGGVSDQVEVPSNIQTTNLRPRAASFANSLAYSTESDDTSTAETSNKDESKSLENQEKDATPMVSPLENSGKSPNPPAKTVTLSMNNTPPAPILSTSLSAGSGSLLPPVFPRTRLNSASTDVGPGAASNKVSKPVTISRRSKTSSSVINPTQRSPKAISRHSREISDVTVDTHQLDIHDIQAMDSNEDDVITDDAWSNIHSQLSTTHNLRLSFVFLVTEKTLTTLKGNTRTQISMLRQVADLYSLSSYDTVTVHRIEQEDEEEVLKAVSADFVVVSIKDQFISRGDMAYFQNALKGSWIYEGQRLIENTKNIKAHAREIRHGNYAAKSGIVTEDTMITFRSRSARIIWLVQLSCEMWDYTSPYEHSYNQEQAVCEICFDQWIRFIYKLFTKWKELEVTHSLTVIFFSRTFLSNGQKSSINQRDVYGRSYEDHYKPVIENETGFDWHSLVVRIKEEFIKYPLEVGWNFDRRPSTASQGNILEAINVTLNLMQYHFLDRDLQRTGQSIVVISPGCGVFEVNKGLAEITYQRMMDNGIGSDMLSLGLPPLHIAPFFLYNNEYHTVETHGVDTSETYYEVPHWMHLSFISYDREEDHDERHHAKHEDAPTEKRKKIGDWMDSYEVTANGFLRPRIDPDALGTDDGGIKTSSFSALGNAAATPGKAKAAQERQLISGRDFRDILEACRPRTPGTTVASSLSSILKLHGAGLKSDISLEARPPSDKNILPLKEWGAVDFDFSDFVFPQKSKAMSIRSDSPSSRRSVLFESLHDSKSDGGESGSDSGSFISHMSHLSSLGVGFDRVLWDQWSASSPIGHKQIIHLQRSISVDFEKIIYSLPRFESTNALTGDSISLASSNLSLGKLSSGGEGDSVLDEDAEESVLSGKEKQIDNLRKMMDAHDTKTCARFGTQDDQVREISVMSSKPSDSELTMSSKGGAVPQNLRSSQPGGLGAALSLYDGFTSPQPPEGTRDKRLTRTLTPGQRGTSFQQERARAASPLFHGMPPMIERSSGARAISPILLPPIAQMQAAELPENSGRGEETTQPSHRTALKESKLLSPREGYAGSTGNLPTLESLDARMYLQHVNPSSMTNFDRDRQKIIPLSRSPPLGNVMSAGTRASKKAMGHTPRKNSRESSTQRKGRESGSMQRRRKKAFNPFRQSDEDEVLAKRSHNRRRWSHVFAVGEIEFKRHAGPIWPSLTSPAILPLSVDYFPSPHELRDESRFQFSPYTVTLSGIDKSHYSTHDELLMEMVRQRVTQDFQIVTASAVEESKSRAAESQRQGRNMKSGSRSWRHDSYPQSLPAIKPDTSGTEKRYLSMGHRIQVMNYDPSSDTIEIVHYNEKKAHNDPLNVFKYRFLLYSSATEKYAKSTQTFKKYADPYKWNKVDNLICGEEENILEEGMRFRRVMFGLIPESFSNADTEQEYTSKFSRLLEYLGKLREKEDSNATLDVKIVTSADAKGEQGDELLTARRGTADSMRRFNVQLKKRKRDPFEWLEIAIDSVFDTNRSYRIMFNWLVASSAKVEAQIQLLHRRCTQFGLRLIGLPQTTISPNLFLHAFAVPSLICIRSKEKASLLDEILKKLDFVHDGIRFTDANVLECIDNNEEYDFPKYRSGKIKAIPSKQYVHRSGALFMRSIRDRQGWVILAGIENNRHATSENRFSKSASRIIREVTMLFKDDSNGDQANEDDD